MTGAPQPDLREAMRASLQQSLTARAMVDSGAPVLAFALLVPWTSVRLASYIALAVGVLLGAERAVRRQSVQQVFAGLLGLGIAVLVANLTGKAKGFYLPGIIETWMFAIVLSVSLVVRRPLIGVLVGVMDHKCHGWRERVILRRAFTRVTAVAAVWYLLKATFSTTLYVTNHATSLAGVRLALGLPPYLLLLAYGFTTVRNALEQDASESVPAGVS